MIITTQHIFIDMVKKFKNVEINIPDSWDNITLRQYLEFSKMRDLIKNDNSVEDTLNTYKLFEILCNISTDELDELLLDEVSEFSNLMTDFINRFEMNETNSQIIKINDVEYTPVQNMNQLTNGEYITLNILREKYESDILDLIPRILAVLIRPSIKDYDFETKTEIIKPEPFNKKDIDNLEFRANLFLNEAKFNEVIPVLNFFLSTKNT